MAKSQETWNKKEREKKKQKSKQDKQEKKLERKQNAGTEGKSLDDVCHDGEVLVNVKREVTKYTKNT